MADHCHIFWCCPIIQPYWLGVFKEMKSILGVSILVNKNSKIDAAFLDRDREGRWVKIRFVFEGFEHRLLNIYAPNKEGNRVSFFQELNGVAKDCTIVMGDFNVKLCRLDVSDDCSFKCDPDFCDLWRTAHPLAREYSRVQSCMGKVKRSRIDYCLVKKSQLKIFNTVL
uniref:Endonuclease/exonuclease/phosphatase domain-containing protein n=1 Tax=Seriola dumerili TaxID=41447 RepID=A0A3B4TRC0_SERDU